MPHLPALSDRNNDFWRCRRLMIQAFNLAMSFAISSGAGGTALRPIEGS